MTSAPPACWALHPNAACALRSHLPWAAPRQGPSKADPGLGAEGLLLGLTLAQGLTGGFAETARDLRGTSALICPFDPARAACGQPVLQASRAPSQDPSQALLPRADLSWCAWGRGKTPCGWSRASEGTGSEKGPESSGLLDCGKESGSCRRETTSHQQLWSMVAVWS